MARVFGQDDLLAKSFHDMPGGFDAAQSAMENEDNYDMGKIQ